MFDIFLAGGKNTEIDNYICEHNYPRLFSQLNDWSGIKDYVDKLRSGNTKSKLFIDSGAFTAKTQGVSVDINEYIRKINTISDSIYCFANLDVIPNSKNHSDLRISAEAGYDNFIHIVENCKCPEKCVAVYHADDPEDTFYRYVEYYKENAKLRYFALGGVVGGSAENVFSFLHKYSAIFKRFLPNVKLHLLGFTKLSKLKFINADSSDSTTWIMVSATGCILTDFGVLLVSDVQKNHPKNALNIDKDARGVVEEYVGKYGFTLKQLSEDYKSRMMWNINYIQEFSKTIEYSGNVNIKKRLL